MSTFSVRPGDCRDRRGSGAVNGFFVAYRGMSAFIVTIATWSIIDGLALLVLPSAGGAVPNGFAL